MQVGESWTSITKCDYGARLGYRIGVGIELPLNKMWHLQSSLFFLNRSVAFEGTKREIPYFTYVGFREMDYIGYSKINALYLQLPIKIGIRFPISREFYVNVSAGPYVACGIGGKSSLTIGTFSGSYYDFYWNGVMDVKDINTFSDDIWKRFDCGLTFGVDLGFKRFFVGANLEYGLTPVATNFPKLLLDYRIGLDGTEVSPHHFGLDIHFGVSF